MIEFLDQVGVYLGEILTHPLVLVAVSISCLFFVFRLLFELIFADIPHAELAIFSLICDAASWIWKKIAPFRRWIMAKLRKLWEVL